MRHFLRRPVRRRILISSCKMTALEGFIFHDVTFFHPPPVPSLPSPLCHRMGRLLKAGVTHGDALVCVHHGLALHGHTGRNMKAFYCTAPRIGVTPSNPYGSPSSEKCAYMVPEVVRDFIFENIEEFKKKPTPTPPRSVPVSEDTLRAAFASKRARVVEPED